VAQLVAFKPWKPCTHKAREVWVFVGRACAFVDPTALLEFGERETAGGDEVALIQHFVTLAIEQDAPIPRHSLVGGTLGADARGAVGGDGIIPAWMSAEGVERMYVFEESLTGLRLRSQDAVEIDIFTLTVVCARGLRRARPRRRR
jgi:hypothetical protein